MRHADTSDVWWKNAVVYCVDTTKYLDTGADASLVDLRDRSVLPLQDGRLTVSLDAYGSVRLIARGPGGRPLR